MNPVQQFLLVLHVCVCVTPMGIHSVQLFHSFSIPAVVVSGDFGTTVGIIYTNIFHVNNSNQSSLGSTKQSRQEIVECFGCTTLNYSIRSGRSFETTLLQMGCYYV